MNPNNNNNKKFKVITGLLCLSVQAIAEAMGIDYSSAENTVWKGLERYRKGGNNWLHFSDSADERRKWISYEHLPEMTRLRVAFKYKDVWAAYYEEHLVDEAVVQIAPDDAAYFHDLHLYSIAQVEQLAEACGWLRMCSPEGWWKDKFGGKITAMQTATKVLKTRQLYGMKVSNWQSLDGKCKKWLVDGRESLVSKLFGNNNKSKLRDVGLLPLHRIIDLYAHGSKLNYLEVADVYNREALDKQWPQYSAERVRQLLADNRNKWVYTRDGIQAARAMQERHLKRKRPEFADQLWNVDGTTLQLGMMKGRDFRKAWTIVVITDSYSDCIVGWAAGSTETQELVIRAMRMAIRRAGYGPSFVQFDNAKANTSGQVSDLYNRLKTVGIPAEPYNGKAKHVERVIGRLEQGVLRHYGNFYGGNVTTRSQGSKANPDYIQQQIKSDSIPTDATVLLQQLQLAVEVYNNTEVKSRKATPAKLYDTLDERRRVVPYLQLVSLFWIRRLDTVRYNKGGLKIEVDKERYEYEVQTEPGLVDEAFLEEHMGNSFIVRYDPDDLSAICLYDQDDHYVATATLKYEFSPVPTKNEGSLLRAALDQRKRQITNGLQQARLIREEMQVEGMEEVSFQLVHKDALNEIQSRMEGQFMESAADLSKYFDNNTAAVPKTRLSRPETRSIYYDKDAAQRLLDAPDIDD